MFVKRTHGVVAATLGVLGLGACDDPEQNTSLRPQGPPEVLAVLVLTDAASHLVEKATYCKPDDDKRPGLVGLPDFTTQQVCPDAMGDTGLPVQDAYPDGWYIRIMFDELLDPSVEELVEVLDADTGEGTDTFTGTIANTRPVTLRCESVTGGMVNVAYDGYYSPSGNRITWPVGPSLVIKPNDATLIATNALCEVSLNDVVIDKQGETVPAAQRGPFQFRVAPIEVIAIDPPDDPEFDDPINAVQIWFDNPYLMFNTFVTLESLCPGSMGVDFSGCNNEPFQIVDIEHPMEGPGYCNTSFDTCGTLADCPAGNTICGRGFCNNNGAVCNRAADCGTGGACQSTYAYRYSILGLSDTEFGVGPFEPLQTERKYKAAFKEGAKLRDRCGRETTMKPLEDELTYVRFITDKFDFRNATILNGETANANKRLQYNWTNVVEGHDVASATSQRDAIAIPPSAVTAGAFTMSPMPKKLTGACPGGGAACPTADLTADKLLFISADAQGQITVAGHLQMNTEYTATLKAGTVVKDFYGKPWTNPMDMVIKWKTQPTIQMTGLTMRYTGQFFGAGDNGTIERPTAATTIDIRIAFNASMDPTTLDVSDVTVEGIDGAVAPTMAVASASGCGTTLNDTNWLGTCTLRLRGTFAAGSYKVTLKKGAEFKDIFGVVYTQAEDQSITVTIEDAPAPASCL